MYTSPFQSQKKTMKFPTALICRPGTNTKEQSRRKLFFVINATVVLFMTVFSMMDISANSMPLVIVSRVLAGMTGAVGVVVMLCKWELRQAHIVGAAWCFSFAVLLTDLSARAVSTFFWAGQVLVVDFLLIMAADARHTLIIVVANVLWLVVMVIEERTRFGILDLPLLYPQELRRERYVESGDCAELPCPSDRVTHFFLAIQVFLIDFIATRGFATEILKEQAAMERTVQAVQEIATLLARYDVEAVARMLDDSEAERLLPADIHAVLTRMEENLRRYRPYLPAALFEEELSDFTSSFATQNAHTPPGLHDDHATIVFTDIRSSVSIWESAPDGMRAGMRIHNAVLRDVLLRFGGYEVKTIGDAFMISFTHPTEGVRFGLSAHEQLRDADWPTSLTDNAPVCAENGSLWGGLTIRVGVNSGPVTIEQNPLTGRADYFGHTVNIAARLESACQPGAVAIRSDLWNTSCESIDASVGESKSLDLHGVSVATQICCVWPLSLAARRDYPLVESDENGAELESKAGTFTSVGSSGSSRVSSSLGPATYARQTFATIGVVELAVGEEQITALRQMNVVLSTLTVALDQTGGMLVTLLGSSVCVGWNVARSAPAHMESAIRFAQRFRRSPSLSGAGLATGHVHHGDVGARNQRFVTVMGKTVRRSWKLCEEAVLSRTQDALCLYEPLEGTPFLSSLELALAPDARSGIYRVIGTLQRESVY